MTAYVHPRLHNRPEVRPLARARRITEVPEMRGTGWVDTLTFDAWCELDGLRWWRVTGGFGHLADREDWVAGVPGRSVSVTGWNMEREQRDVTAAMREAVDRALAQAPGHVQEARDELAIELEREASLQNAVNRRRVEEVAS